MNMSNDIQNKLAQIRNIYWHIRQVRPFQTALRRKHYRDASKIKEHLISSGIDEEELRLWCRTFTKKFAKSAELRLQRYRENHTSTFTIL
jgi:hypothetical protein